MPRYRTEAGVLLLVGLALSFAGSTLAGQEKSKAKEPKEIDAGIKISTQATAREVGLPVYPGATPHRDDKEDSSGANLGFWGGSFGIKLIVLKMETKDAPRKVVAYYQQALAKYGKVLDCSHPPQSKKDDNPKDSNVLSCEDDKPDEGGMLFKAGTKHRQHLVGIRPQGQGTVFQLVYLETRGVEGDERPQ
jgi:hypothetical protein